MTKKFTEEEYQKIVDIADKYFEQHKELAVTVNLKNIYDYIFYNETVESKKIKDLSQELVLIALPKYRDWAHDQFVEKEKKYYWISKKRLPTGQYKFLWKNRDGLPYGVLATTPSKPDAFTEAEVHEACYDPDMFDKEEVE